MWSPGPVFRYTPFMTNKHIEQFTESLGRCLARPAFLSRFYRRFIGSSDEIADKFRDTDMEKQKAALSASLYLAMLAADGGDAAMTYLESVAQRHSRGQLDIRPELYDIWLDCLIETVKEQDPMFSAEVEQGWRETLQFTIGYMRDRY